MSLPGERAALERLYSPFSTSDDKAEAALKLREIDAIRAHNAESDWRWREQRRAQEAQQEIRKGVCPACGRGPDVE